MTNGSYLPTSPRLSDLKKYEVLIIITLKFVQAVPLTLHKDIGVAFSTVSVAYALG
jgi:hypothetical protein